MFNTRSRHTNPNIIIKVNDVGRSRVFLGTTYNRGFTLYIHRTTITRPGAYTLNVYSLRIIFGLCS